MTEVRPGPSCGDASESYWDLALDGLRRCWTVLDRFEQPVSQRLFELAEIEPGDTVLDVATGIGEPALTIARRLGPSGRVIGIDRSAALLEFARYRARDAGVSNIEFRQMDAEAIVVPERSLQSIVCRWGLMFLEDLAGALCRMRGGLVPGRRLAAAVWSDSDKVPIISVRRRVMRDFDLPVPSLNPFSLSSPSTLHAAVASGGFGDIRVETMNVAYAFASVEEYVELQRDLHGNRLFDLPEQSPERQAAFWVALAAEARGYTRADGVVNMSSEVLVVSAQA
jgi:SAM-dependent methyltransferase